MHTCTHATPHLTGMTLPYLDPKKERIAAASNALLFAGHVGYHELRRRQDILMEGMLVLLVGLYTPAYVEHGLI